jgi:hypothetical protein
MAAALFPAFTIAIGRAEANAATQSVVIRRCGAALNAVDFSKDLKAS